MATRSIVPRANAEGGIGSENKKWQYGYFVNLFAENVTEGTGIWGNLDNGFSDSTFGGVTPIDGGASA